MEKYKVLVLGPGKKTKGGITSVINEYEKTEKWSEYKCKWIETYNDKNNISKIWYFIKSFIVYLLHIKKSEIVHIHLSEPISAIRKALYFFIAKQYRKKTIIHFHSYSVDTTIKSKYNIIYKYLFGNCDSLIVLSEYWKKEVVDAFGKADDTYVVFNPCKNKNVLFADKKKIVLYAGTLNKRKGYSDLLMVFKNIVQLFPDWKLVICGNGELENAQKIINDYLINDNVCLKGWVSGKEKDQIFRDSSIFCLPSYNEGFPMSVLDAWSYNIPIVSTNVGGLKDILIDEYNSLIFSPGDLERMQHCLSEMISSKEKRESIVKNTNYLIDNNFDIDSVMSKIITIYNK